jgi:hypothetical protein
MPSRKKRGANKTRKGGAEWLRGNALIQGKTVRTFCCGNKTQSEYAWGTSNTNVGTNCLSEKTGQCDDMRYKFRCFDTNPASIYKKRYQISEKEGSQYEKDGPFINEKCKYVASNTGKVLSTVGNVTTKPVSYIFSTNENSKTSTNENIKTAGKKSKRKTPKSKHRSTKRK